MREGSNPVRWFGVVALGISLALGACGDSETPAETMADGSALVDTHVDGPDITDDTRVDEPDAKVDVPDTDAPDLTATDTDAEADAVSDIDATADADDDTTAEDTATADTAEVTSCEGDLRACDDLCVPDSVEQCGTRCVACPTSPGPGATTACEDGFCVLGCTTLTLSNVVGPWCQPFAGALVSQAREPSRRVLMDRDGTLSFVGGGQTDPSAIIWVEVGGNPTIETTIGQAPGGGRILATAYARDPAGRPHAAFAFSDISMSPTRYGAGLVRPAGPAFETVVVFPAAEIYYDEPAVEVLEDGSNVVAFGGQGLRVARVVGTTVIDVSPAVDANTWTGTQLIRAPNDTLWLLARAIDDTCLLWRAPTTEPEMLSWTLDRTLECSAAALAIGSDGQPRLAFGDSTRTKNLVVAVRATDGGWTDDTSATSGNVEKIGLGLDRMDVPYVATRAGPESLYYGQLRAGVWRFQPVANSNRIAASPGIVLDASGTPYLTREVIPNGGTAVHTPECQPFQECGGTCGRCTGGAQCVNGGLCEP